MNSIPIAAPSQLHWTRFFIMDSPIPQKSIDFHALRTAFVTYLGLSADDPTTLLQVARHSNLDFSVKTYGRTTTERKQAAIEKTYDLIHNRAT